MAEAPPPDPLDEQDDDSSIDVIGYVAAFTSCFILAAQNTAAKTCLSYGMTPEDLVAIRFCLPGLFWCPLFAWRMRQPDRWRFLKQSIVFATVSGVPYGLILTSGYRLSSASHGSVLVPSATLIGGMVLSRFVVGSSIGKSALSAAGVALVGMVLVSSGGSEQPSASNPFLGDALFVLAGFFWSCNPVSIQHFRAEPRDVVPGVMALSLLYLPFYLGTDNLLSKLQSGTGPETQVVVGAVVFYALIHSSFALPLYAWATGRLTALRMALLTPFIPVCGVLLAVLALNERLNAREIAGGLLVCFALYLSVRMKSEKRRPS